MISEPDRTCLNVHLANLRSALQTNNIRSAKKICEEMQEDLTKIPRDWDKMMEGLQNYCDQRKQDWYRVFTNSYDSGWLLPGKSSHASAKYHAKHHLPPGANAYYITKTDFLEQERWTPESGKSPHGNPETIWDWQPPWKNNFPIPSDKPKPKPAPEPGPDMTG